jgi:ATP-dependent DNA helicase RecG
MPIIDPGSLLRRLLQETSESTWLEFKHGNCDPQEIGNYVSALANAAILGGKDRAFLVFGVEDKTKLPIGTAVRLKQLKVGGENFHN